MIGKVSSDPKTTWLLLDIGNVLLLKDGGRSFTELLADELGVNMELAQKINKAHYTTMDIKNIPEEVFVTTLERDLGYKAPANIFSYFEKAYEKQVRPNTELFDFLDEARASGIKTAVLSNTIAVYSRTQKRLGISKENGFDPVLYSWEVEMLKPNIEIFELAVKRLEAKPEEIIFIDDKLEHIQSARRAGMRAVLFGDTKKTISKIRQLCTFEQQ